MNALAQFLQDTVYQGLKRKSILTASQWAEMYRVMGGEMKGPWSFKYFPWLRTMHDCEDYIVACQKAAQMGFTEYALNKCFKKIDIDQIDVLYALPTVTPGASDFSKSRFDEALELSDHLSDLFSSVKNVGHKRAGAANLYIRGSRSREAFKSIPVGLIVLDEIDEMVQEHIELVFERLSGHDEKQIILISTPTIEGYGINKYAKQSSQDHFFFKCPHCNKLTELTFPECLIISSEDYGDIKIKESYYICKECGVKLDQETKWQWLESGIWVPKYENRISRGFYIPQLYSSKIAPWEMATSYLKAQVDPSAEQEFYNSKLGIPHVVKGSQITDSDINQCIGTYKTKHLAGTNTFTTMGIDVGKFIHVEIDEWFLKDNTMVDVNLNAVCKVLKAEKYLDFADLPKLMMDYHVNFCVIDAQPERRKAYEFAVGFFGIIKLCYFGNDMSTRDIKIHPDEDCTITVDKTSWIDISLGRFKIPSIQLPLDIPVEYRNHIKALVRIYDYGKNRMSNKDAIKAKPVGRYVRGNDEDHYALARTYNEIALPLGLSTFTNKPLD